MLRAGNGDALGEKDLEKDLGDHLIKLGCSEGLAKEQVQRLRRALDFVAKRGEDKEEEVMDRELEEEMVSEEEGSFEVSEDEMVDWRESAVDKEKNRNMITTANTAGPKVPLHTRRDLDAGRLLHASNFAPPFLLLLSPFPPSSLPPVLPFSPPCFTRQPENSKRAHLRVPAMTPPSKINFIQ